MDNEEDVHAMNDNLKITDVSTVKGQMVSIDIKDLPILPLEIAGCITLTNEEMEELYQAVPIETPIEIKP